MIKKSLGILIIALTIVTTACSDSSDDESTHGCSGDPAEVNVCSEGKLN
ncbi:hypothetical protein GCM10008967_28190 [Bacillus carboniphilus]|uniref:Lipoprotein n=1 Tax=Bacillus carboniphilus TaxID=86663 RepID=A0ABP3G4X6_9BACI